jgi:uncharacterized membrane protein YjgN (DUF898 family)
LYIALRGSGEMPELPTYAIIIGIVAVLLITLVWLLRDSFSRSSYESQTVNGVRFHFSDQFNTIDDLPEKIAPGSLMVECKKCGESYSSGIVLTTSEAGRFASDLNVTTTCPFCRQRNVTSP